METFNILFGSHTCPVCCLVIKFKMEGLIITLIITCVHIEAQRYHEYGVIVTCEDNINLEDFLVTLDDELVAHVDMEKKQDVYTVPDFIGPVQYPSLYQDALRTLAICKKEGDVLKEVYINSSEQIDSTTLSRYYPNKDGTMNVFSRLSFIPVEGDIYSCTVEHKALEQPQTRIWEVEIKESSNGPSVFCGVGLGFGLIGVAVGIFFIVKGNNCN
ncbi:H-2 class II histocompatibility antigen, E-D alpha chain-like isoform X2 [Paramisgurnus dabryanus]|uniref:H-2 class II histocompatibility antigen, E-D alpha chain-like isoform X2 n=1 Tax=Paramisgurnus dabryanus TaxID=90735 RepID=UPI0031F35D73